MRVVVVGAEGHLGARLLAGLIDDSYIEAVVSLVDRSAPSVLPSVRGVEERVVDLTTDLSGHFRFADAVVAAGWPVTGGTGGPARLRGPAILRRTCTSVAAAEVPTLVCGCSAAAYTPAPAGQAVDEAWPARAPGVRTSLDPIVEIEHLLDAFEADHPVVRVVRLRTSLVVGPPGPGPGIAGVVARWLTGALAGGRRLRVVPDLGGHSVQPVHIDDLQRAFRAALASPVGGPFNVAAEPVDGDALTTAFGARRVPVPLRGVARAWTLAAQLGLRAGDPWRVTLALDSPRLDTGRARRELGWQPRHSSAELLEDWVARVTGPVLPLLAEAPPVKVGVGGPDRHPGAAAGPDPGPDPQPAESPGRLYEMALQHFGGLVHSIGPDQWADTTGDDGRTVLELVSDVALDQYRLALCLEGAGPDEADRRLPGDPLGFHRVDGWDLAAERVRLAFADRFGSAAPAGWVVAEPGIEAAMLDRIRRMTVLGGFLTGALGREPVPTADPTATVGGRSVDGGAGKGGAGD